MILDASAVVSIIVAAPASSELLDKLQTSAVRGIGAPTLLECEVVLGNKLRRDARPVVAALVRELQLQVVPFGEEHARAATDAFYRFGKGRHPARLNFGDCMSYAVAKLANQPLLCTGNDFAQTDLELA